MVLYHAISVYQLLVCMCLRLLYAPNKLAVCILPDFIVRKFPEYKRIEEQGIFDRVVLYPYMQSPMTSSMKIVEQIGDAFWEDSFSYSLHDFEEIYCAGTQFHFSSYLVSKKVHFSYIEEGSGMWAQIKGFKKTQSEINPVMYELTESNGLYDGSSPYIEKIYACIPPEIEAREGDFADPRLVRFNIQDELKSLSEEQADIICNVFGCQELRLPPADRITILLTDHAANLNLLLLDEQIRRNMLTVDYFHSKSHLVVKPHPDDLTEYRYYFFDATILNHLFPIELLMRFFDSSCYSIVHFGSSSLNNMEGREVLNLGGGYSCGGFEKVHRLYAAWMIYRRVSEQISCKMDIVGDYENIFQWWNSMEPKHCFDGGPESRILLVCGGRVSAVDLKSALHTPKSMVVLDELYDTALDIVCDQNNEICSKYIEITDESKNEKRCEFLYVLTADEEMLQIAKDVHYQKHLKYTGGLVKVGTVEETKAKSIAIEMILRDTERRLLVALEENEHLKFELYGAK